MKKQIEEEKPLSNNNNDENFIESGMFMNAEDDYDNSDDENLKCYDTYE